MGPCGCSARFLCSFLFVVIVAFDDPVSLILTTSVGKREGGGFFGFLWFVSCVQFLMICLLFLLASLVSYVV